MIEVKLTLHITQNETGINESERNSNLWKYIYQKVSSIFIALGNAFILKHVNNSQFKTFFYLTLKLEIGNWQQKYAKNKIIQKTKDDNRNQLWILSYITSLNVMLFIFRHSFIHHTSCCLLFNVERFIAHTKQKRFQMFSKHRQIFGSWVLGGLFFFATQTNLRSIKINIIWKPSITMLSL